jgi:hypothetical protein
MRADLGLVDERIKSGVTKQRSNTMDKHGRAAMHSAWPTMSNPTFRPGKILPPCSKSLVQGINMTAPPGQKPVKARTVEDGLRSVGQAYARLPPLDPHKDAYDSIDLGSNARSRRTRRMMLRRNA